ncbi:aldehyde dehydrogenase-like protein [Halenospora varia]|nr:aldehyde dehydrogenase-like protein [Halenospora varia]
MKSDEIETRLFINGEFVESSDGGSFKLTNPSTLEVFTSVSEATADDVDRAVATAKAAQPGWAALTVEQRGSYFKKLAKLIRERNDDFATLEAMSMGHPKSHFFHAMQCATTIDHYSEAGYDMQGKTSLNTPGYINMTLRQPYGVAAIIIPWNVPLIMVSKKVMPALTVGNTVILKSSEKAPLTSCLFAALVKEAGFPPGVLNVISGFGNVSGAALSSHMDVRVLSFTGSTRTGRMIQQAAAQSNLKEVFLELGGKSPVCIFDDADLERAAQDTQASVQVNSGQTCMATTRVYVQDTVAEKFVALFKSKFEASAKMGDPLDNATTHGPQADKVQFENVMRFLEVGKKEATVALGGDKADREGYYIQPTIFTNVPEDAQIMKQEIFGPVVNINIFSTEEDVLAKANDTEYGLYASVYTKDLDRAMRFAKGMEAGTVGINCTAPTTGKDMPFGGYKGSGSGREGWPQYSMENFLETKSVGMVVAEVCIDPLPGPCKYCAHIGAACGVATRRKQRPFYHVTEEEYRCSMRILQHFLPSQDLTLQTLRKLAKDIDSCGSVEGSPVQIIPQQQEEAAGTANDVEEVGDLHEQLGCLMQDSMGEYRYVGAQSEIAFNAAVCSMKGPPSPEKVIGPSKFAFPPQKPPAPAALLSISTPDQMYLPPRDRCNQYVDRFFEEVHCVYWLYPAEQFYARLDATYADRSVPPSYSWLCSLYSMFALGAASTDESPSNSVSNDNASHIRTTHDYLALAKALVPHIHDEADIDSIRALAILSIALQTFGFRITSYLYLGTGIRIAFSLGLHHDKAPFSQSLMTRQQNRRIWWTLYILDQATASRCGSPNMIDERSLGVLNPGTNTPLGILSVSTSLCRLRKDMIQSIYPQKSSDRRKVSHAKINSFLAALKTWLESVPSHLVWGIPVAPSHKRSIAILHLKYWDATMLLTQPFILYLVLRGQNLSAEKREWFEKLGDTCIDAAKNALVILQTMAADKTISSLITLDVTCAMKVVMVLVLAFVRSNSEELRQEIKTCVALIQGMEQVGFCKTATQELPLRLADLGLWYEQEEQFLNYSQPEFTL